MGSSRPENYTCLRCGNQQGSAKRCKVCKSWNVKNSDELSDEDIEQLRKGGNNGRR